MYNGFFRFTSGTTPADLLVASKVAMLFNPIYLHQAWIQDFVKMRAQLLRPKVADIVKQCCVNGVNYLWALEAFGFLMLKYALFNILETLFLSFLTASSTPKTDKNNTLHCTSINFQIFLCYYTLCKFAFFIS